MLHKTELVKPTPPKEEEYKQPEEYPISIRTLSNVIAEYVENIQRDDKGVLEDYFFDYASPILGANLRSDVSVILPPFNQTPDFVYIDKEQNLFIAIEIDEPYSINNQGAPISIHCLGDDDKRNRSLINNGWHVIRFAEEQIAKSPKGCAEYILNFVLQRKVEVLPICKCWTMDEAVSMFHDRYRDTYLPMPFNTTSAKRSTSAYRSFGVSIIRGINILKTGEKKVVIEFNPNNSFTAIGHDNWVSYGRCYIDENLFWNQLKRQNIAFEFEKHKSVSMIPNCNYQIFIQGVRFEGVGVVGDSIFHLNQNGNFKLVLPSQTKPLNERELTREEKIKILEKYGYDFVNNVWKV